MRDLIQRAITRGNRALPGKCGCRLSVLYFRRTPKRSATRENALTSEIETFLCVYAGVVRFIFTRLSRVRRVSISLDDCFALLGSDPVILLSVPVFLVLYSLPPGSFVVR